MNRLAHESSPYLLQHAHNPVDWYPWGKEALRRAREEDKPILVSIGYSTCHWCHVMERESFEDPLVADFMNAHFVNIKVDREERPDLDQIYMEALSILSGSGGWPLNCFLTPDGRPFYGGTYFPPKPMYRRPSWMQALQHIRQSFRTNRDTVEEQADQVTELLKQSKEKMFEAAARSVLPPDMEHDHLFTAVFSRFSESFDSVNGGYGRAPKFPSAMMMQFVLHHYHYTNDQEAIGQIKLTLSRMIDGGIYDQLGGGFARYATDDAWLVPHFEKMLYDNALLVTLMADVYRYTREDFLRKAMDETIGFVNRELSHPDGGMYAALDADSEGEEGKFYVWTKKEVEAVLGPDRAKLFCRVYDVKSAGNWEGKTILRRVMTNEVAAKILGINPAECAALLDQCRQLLLEAREQRVRPGLDNKVLLDWNALMIAALFRATRATGEQAWGARAMQALHFVEQYMQQPDGQRYFHSWKDGKAKQPAFLDDYANLIRAFLEAWQYTSDSSWLHKANSLTELVVEDFFDPADGFFFFTSREHDDILLRKKELNDNATPSGNAVMASCLLTLGLVLDRQDYREIADRLYQSMLPALKRFPGAFSEWLTGLTALEYGWYEVAVVGADFRSVMQDVRRLPLVNAVVAGSDQADATISLLRDKTPAGQETAIYLCKNYTCRQPVDSAEALLYQIRTEAKNLRM